MPITDGHWTLEMVHALPDDGNRYELVDGTLLVSPAPTARHQRVLLALVEALLPYARASHRFELFVAPIAVTFSGRRELQPDLSVWPLVLGQPVERFEDAGRLLLAIEILSPGSERHDRFTKRAVYLEEGVPEYWIVSPDARCIERWRLGVAEPEIVAGALAWQPSEGVDPLIIDVAGIFGD